MKCKTIQIRLADYSAQLLSPAEAVSIQRHLESCPDCARFLQEEAALTDGLLRMQRVEPRADLWSKVALELDAPQPASSRRSLAAWLVGWQKPAAALAASAAIVAGLLIADGKQNDLSQIASRDTPPPPPTITTISPNLNPEVDDPLSQQMDSLYVALDRMTQDE